VLGCLITWFAELAQCTLTSSYLESFITGIGKTKWGKVVALEAVQDSTIPEPEVERYFTELVSQPWLAEWARVGIGGYICGGTR